MHTCTLSTHNQPVPHRLDSQRASWRRVQLAEPTFSPSVYIQRHVNAYKPTTQCHVITYQS